MPASNLPPDCTDRDIPGNRYEDELIDRITDLICVSDLTTRQLEELATLDPRELPSYHEAGVRALGIVDKTPNDERRAK